MTIKTGLGIQGVYSINSSWSNQEAQIDLIIDRDDNIIHLVEVKFYHGEFAIDKHYYENLKKKMAAFQNETNTHKNLHLLFITTYGMKKNMYYNELVQNDIEMKDLFL